MIIFSFLQKVVYIFEHKNLRTAAGHLKLFADNNIEWVQFSPVDSRLPRMQIPLRECPFDFYLNSQNYQKTLFLAQIVDMPQNMNYAIGTLRCIIGMDGDIAAETEAILLENGVDSTELNEDLLKDCLPELPWRIPTAEYSYRRDLRDYCVFTIDPSTARDLDDALHVVQLSDEIYEVGVHIADVSYFVEHNSPIDRIASERTTSVYLVQKVIPMLPRCLCENLCSLNPSEERLTFSVIWKINSSSGDILEEWFGRTIINSVSKLSYENAQKFIENPDKEFTNPDEFPKIRDGFTLKQVKDSVLNLDKIAKQLRKKRYNNGCLSLTQTKLSFIINKETSMPFGYHVYEQKDSNKLVEEFMLLANIAVAHRIYNKYPQQAVLRRHPPPNSQQIQQVSEMVKDYGHHVDIATSNTIQVNFMMFHFFIVHLSSLLDIFTRT
jgi:DIS3-like exonuclease 2